MSIYEKQRKIFLAKQAGFCVKTVFRYLIQHKTCAIYFSELKTPSGALSLNIDVFFSECTWIHLQPEPLAEVNCCCGCMADHMSPLTQSTLR